MSRHTRPEPLFSAPAEDADHVATSRAPIWSESPLEREMLGVLERPSAGETVETAYRRKECELVELFSRLTISDARALHRRLSNPSPDDPLATRFGRMIAERRQRLLAFLDGAWRREALGQAAPVYESKRHGHT